LSFLIEEPASPGNPFDEWLEGCRVSQLYHFFSGHFFRSFVFSADV
jgi:hypothetical protein